MNVLILSAGTRSVLVGYFMNRKNGFDKVIATDCSTFAPAIYVADRYYIVPQMKEPEYLDALVEICRKEEIQLIVPLHEDELLLISQNKLMFEALGILVAVSDNDKIKLCRDKLATCEALAKQNISTVATYRAEEYKYKTDTEVVVKPRTGAGSVNTMVIKNKALMDAYIASIDEDMIVQPYLTGKEYGIDLYVDFISRKAVSIFVKEKIRMRAGETEKSISVINQEIASLAIKAAESLMLVGPIDMDIMEADGEYKILEINPRFGGGYPHAYLCGINFIRLLFRNVTGESNLPSLNNYLDNVKAMKYSDIMMM